MLTGISAEERESLGEMVGIQCDWMLDLKDFSNLENSVKSKSKVLQDWSSWNVFFVLLKP